MKSLRKVLTVMVVFASLTAAFSIPGMMKCGADVGKNDTQDSTTLYA